MNSNIDYKNFGKTLRALRNEKKVTQQTVCDAVGISNTHYSNIENGVAKPSLDVLVSIANYYDIPLSSTMLSDGLYYKISYDIKSIFDRISDDEVLKVLDIVSYAQKHLYE